MRDFFICEHCEGESFDEIRLLKKYECEATGTISKCDNCDFASNDVPSIVKHVREAHKPVHQWHFCKYKATVRNAGTEHIMNNHPDLTLLNTVAVQLYEISSIFSAFETFKGWGFRGGLGKCRLQSI